MEERKNIYEAGDVTPEERKRLQEFGYPFLVSRELIGADVKDKAILDVGAGANTALQKWIAERGGRYIAFDIGEQYLKDQQAEGASAVRGTAEHLPFKEGSVDIVHARFLLTHLSEAQRTDAIRDAIRAARERALFLEFDWSSFRGGAAANGLRDLALKVMLPRSDPYIGGKLGKLIAEATPDEIPRMSEERKSRDPGNYYGELQGLFESLKGIIERVRPGLLSEAGAVEKAIKEEMAREEPEPFTPPDIVTVEVRRT